MSDLCSLATDEHTAQHTLQWHMKVCEAHGQVPRHESVAVVSPQHKLRWQKKKRRQGQRMMETVFNCNHSKRRRLSHRTVTWEHLFSTTDSYFVLKRLHISAPSTMHLFLDACLCV